MEKKKINSFISYFVFTGAICLAVFAIAGILSVFSIIDFFNGPSIDGPSQVLTERIENPGKQLKDHPMALVKKSDGIVDNSKDREELDSMFRDFLEEKGVSYEEEIAAVKAYSPPLDNNDAPFDEKEEEFPVVVEKLMDTYDVEDAKVTGNGEIWIRLDTNNFNENAIDEMMTEAANLYGDKSGPVRVVVWQGNRTRAVRTFFGQPMF